LTFVFLRQQASSAARRGLADGSFRKVDVTTSTGDAFDIASESALEVYNISDVEGTDGRSVETRHRGIWTTPPMMSLFFAFIQTITYTQRFFYSLSSFYFSLFLQFTDEHIL
jgi:hypothetical protein